MPTMDWKAVHERHKRGGRLRYGLLCVAGVFLVAILCVTPEIIEMFKSTGLLSVVFIALLFLLGWLPWRTVSIGSRQIPFAQHRDMWLLTTCLIVPIYFLSLLTFSYVVFPFIPAVRGGGDYSAAPQVSIIYRDGKAEDKEILLEETAAALFVAKPQNAVGPCEWRANPESRPEVTMIGRADISKITYLSPSKAYTDC